MALAVHLVAGVLCLVCPDDGQHVVPLQKLTAGIVAAELTEKTETTSHTLQDVA